MHAKRSQASRWFVVAALAVMLGACAEEPEPQPMQPQAAAPGPAARRAPGARAKKAQAEAPAQDAAAEPATEPATEPAEAGAGVVVKRFKPSRDPFKSIFEQAGASRTIGEITHPLQQFTIPQLQILGIIWGIAQPVALIATPDNNEYIVRVGTPVGTGDGKVVAILQNCIVIVERYYDYRGQLQTEKYELCLPSGGE